MRCTITWYMIRISDHAEYDDWLIIYDFHAVWSSARLTLFGFRSFSRYSASISIWHATLCSIILVIHRHVPSTASWLAGLSVLSNTTLNALTTKSPDKYGPFLGAVDSQEKQVIQSRCYLDWCTRSHVDQMLIFDLILIMERLPQSLIPYTTT